MVQTRDPGTGQLFDNGSGHTSVQNASLYTPSRDVFQDWFFGDDVTDATLTAGSANDGAWLDMREINPDARTIVIMCLDAGPLDFDYVLYFSRSGIDADQYSVATGTTITAQNTAVIPTGYDQYVKLEITPDAGQAGDKLKFKAYLTGRGG